MFDSCDWRGKLQIGTGNAVLRFLRFDIPKFAVVLPLQRQWPRTHALDPGASSAKILFPCCCYVHPGNFSSRQKDEVHQSLELRLIGVQVFERCFELELYDPSHGSGTNAIVANVQSDAVAGQVRIYAPSFIISPDMQQSVVPGFQLRRRVRRISPCPELVLASWWECRIIVRTFDLKKVVKLCIIVAWDRAAAWLGC